MNITLDIREQVQEMKKSEECKHLIFHCHFEDKRGIVYYKSLKVSRYKLLIYILFE